MRGPWEQKQFRRPIIVEPQEEVAASETLDNGVIQDVRVHIIALLKKVVAKLGEGEAVEATLERTAPLALWYPREPMPCHSR